MRNLFFDLDGTLTDAAVGITRCIQYALQSLNEPVPDADALNWCLGPPLWHSFAELLTQPSRERIGEAVAAYRDRFTRVGIFENRVYPGIVDCLGGLRSGGRRLYVVTSKPRVYAAKITDHFELSPFFERVHGPELDDEQSTKTSLIADLLASEGIAASAVAMVGDRKLDVVGARANGVFAIGACWGYGGREELLSAGADRLLESPEELLAAMSE